jgi:hypothetical protein
MKPSKAASELCEKLKLMQRKEINGLRTGPWHPKPDALAIIDAFMADLLEKADAILCEVRDRNPNKIALMKALEPWEAGE